MSSTFRTMSDIPFLVFLVFQSENENRNETIRTIFSHSLFARSSGRIDTWRPFRTRVQRSFIPAHYWDVAYARIGLFGVRHATLNVLFIALFTHTWDMIFSFHFFYFFLSFLHRQQSTYLHARNGIQKMRNDEEEKKQIIGIVSWPPFTLFTNLCVLEFSNLTAVCSCDYSNRDKSDNSNWNIYKFFVWIFKLSVKQFRIGDGFGVSVCVYTRRLNKKWRMQHMHRTRCQLHMLQLQLQHNHKWLLLFYISKRPKIYNNSPQERESERRMKKSKTKTSD